MGRQCLSMKLQYLLVPLLAFAQVAQSAALPVADQPCPDSTSDLPPQAQRAYAPRIQAPPSPANIPGVLPLPNLPPYNPPVNPLNGLPVIQIGDGQVQAITNYPPGRKLPPFFPLKPTPTSTQQAGSAQQNPVNSSPGIPAGNPGQTLSTRTTTSIVIQSTAIVVTVSPILPDKSLTSLTTSAVQSATKPVGTNTSGSLHTDLETSGNPSVVPFPTSVSTATSELSLVNPDTISATPIASISVTSIDVNNIFRPIATDAPPAQLPQRSDHPVPRLGVRQQQQKLETNKFYSNFLLGTQTQQTWTFPYSVAWSKGGGRLGSYGMSISHIERSQIAAGATRQDSGAWSYFTNPILVQSIILSAAQLGTGTTLTTDSLEGFSVNVNLQPAGSQTPLITFPLVQGMGFVSAKYNQATPLISSGIGISRVTYSGTVPDTTGHKYRFSLTDGNTWLVYVFPDDVNYAATNFTLLSSGLGVQGASGFSGLLQVAKIPGDDNGAAEGLYDDAAGVYPVSASISGSVAGTAGSYTISWTKQGNTGRRLMMYALPHHLQSLSPQTRTGLTTVRLMTTTKGSSTAILGDSWTLSEPSLPVSMNFAPWLADRGSITRVSAQAQALINQAATEELAQNMFAQSNLNSMYFSGKALAKFAAVVYAAHDMANNVTLALTGLQKLKAAMQPFIDNKQPIPLAYDNAWGGVVSTGSYGSGDAGQDFGNSYYNDHHFHYGYFVYTAAVIGYLDPTWLLAGTNKAWVNALVRDYANPVNSDPYFPFSRSFDWYHGHSWAKGLFESADGKDQESSSEDTMASYAMKMWGRIIGDFAMEARGNLMLAVQARSFSNYYLYTSDNTVAPPQFIGNKAAGILFENKIDHTTYFGNNREEIEGIHMIPLMPFSPLARSKQFVQEEWDTYFTTYASSLQGGWRGILMANLAIINPVASFNFFANTTGAFQTSMLDGGASQTWYLAFSAALGGSPANVQARDVEEVQETALIERDADVNELDLAVIERDTSSDSWIHQVVRRLTAKI